MPTELPAALVTAEGGPSTVRVCARHGEPAAEHRRTVFRSPVPRWAYVLVLVGVLPFLLVAYFVRRKVIAPGWPFCPRCRQLRVIRLLVGIGLMVVSALALALVASLAPSDSGYGNLVGLLLAVVFIVGLGVASMAASGSIAGGTVSGDGATLRLRTPHPRFAERLAGVQRAAAGQWAARHGYVPQGAPAPQGQPPPVPQGQPAPVPQGRPAGYARPGPEQQQQWQAPLPPAQDPWAGRTGQYGQNGAGPA